MNETRQRRLIVAGVFVSMVFGGVPLPLAVAITFLLHWALKE